MRHDAQWTSPSPFWDAHPDASDLSRAAVRQPAILRFAADSFMDDFHRTLDAEPAKLPEFAAEFETWEGPGVSVAGVRPSDRSTTSLERKLTRLRTNADRKVAMFGLNKASGTSAVGVLDQPALGTATTAPRRLKLYQPAHRRFYLIAANVVCGVAGLPDRTINAARQERVSFVIRRIRFRRASDGSVVRTEYGFVPSGNGGAWLKVDQPGQSLAPKEETLPLFSVNFVDDAAHRRRVMAGLIPVGRREMYVGGPEAVPPPSPPAVVPAADLIEPGAPPPPVDPRIVLLSSKVIEPWKALVLRTFKAAAVVRDFNATVSSAPSGAITDPTFLVRENRATLQAGSWYVLLDFATFLHDHVNDVWQALTGEGPTTLGDPKRQALVTAITNTRLPSSLLPPSSGRLDTEPDLLSPTAYVPPQPALPTIQVAATLKDALVAVLPLAESLESATNSFNRVAPGPEWPKFLFPLADADRTGAFVAVEPAAKPPASLPTAPDESVEIVRRISALRALVAEALPSISAHAVADLPIAAEAVMAPDEVAVFVVRCVFERPECGPLDPPLLSAPSRDFEMASFFDPEAPARPIRIALPVDTSLAGFRRAPKNTAFMISDILCGQINRAKKLGFIDLVLSVLPWPFHKDLPAGGTKACADQLGMICSLSIPIITICALILLIIIVTLLDVIFGWLPYLIFCFPLPKFSAKPPKELTS